MPLSLQHYVQIVATKNTVPRQGRAAITQTGGRDLTISYAQQFPNRL